jgi:hypothetical protein
VTSTVRPLRPAAASGSGQRFVGLDVARALAMILALLTHALVQVSSADQGFPPAFNAALRLATPVFILLFGAMIPIVHVRRLERDGSEALWQRSLSRAVQCYLLYALNVASLMVRGDFGPAYALTCLLFLGSTPYAAILKYYAILFLVLPLIVVAVRRHHLLILVAAGSVVHLCYPLIRAIPDPPAIMGRPLLERATDLTIGVGDQLAGPSIVHSLVLLFAGCWLGSLLRRAAGPQPLLRRSDLALGLVLAGMTLFSLYVSRPITLEALGSMRLRNDNHPAYVFVLGGAAMLLVLTMARLFWTRTAPAWLTLLSRRSLFTFGFGNVIVTLWPDAVTRLAGTMASATLLLGTILLVVWFYDRALLGGGGGIGSGTRRLAASVTELIDRLAARLVTRARRRPAVAAL